VHGRLGRASPGARRRALPPGRGREGACGLGRRRRAGEPPREELEGRRAPEALEQDPVATAVDRQCGRGVEGVRGGLRRAGGELGDAEVQERQRAARVVDRDREALARAVAPHEPTDGGARGADVRARTSTQQRGERGDVVLAVGDAGEQQLRAAQLARSEAGARGGDREAAVGRGRPSGGHDGVGRLAAEEEVEPLVGEDVEHPGRGARRDDVRDRLAAAPMVGEPAPRTRVQAAPQPGRLHPQARPQQLGEERVVAIPALVAVDRREEHAGAVQVGERAGAVGAVGQDVGELAAQLVDDARAQEEAARLRALEGEDLAGQVVGDRVVVAGELAQEPVRVALGLERERGEPQAGGPALGPLDEPLDLVGAELEVVLGEQGASLRRGEGEVRRAQLAEPALDAHPAEGEAGVGPRCDDQVQHVPAHRGQRVDEPERGAAQDVEVVEDEDDRGGRALEGGAELTGEIVRGQDPCAAAGRRRHAHAGRRERARDLLPQPGDVAVLGTQRQPGGVARRRPAGEQDGLARPRRAGDGGQRVRGLAVERALEASAPDRGERGDRHPSAGGPARSRGNRRSPIVRRHGTTVPSPPHPPQ
jgi:hypothetical protein